MTKTVLITLTSAGADSGPFDLYSNTDGYIIPFETSIARVTLLAGFVSSNVPDTTTTIRIKSVGALCSNYIDVAIVPTSTTTTTTTTV